MSFTQGAPLPDIKETTTQAQAAPDYYTNYLRDLSSAGTGALTRTAAEGVAGLDPLQTQGYQSVSTAAGAYQPGLSSAATTAQGAGGVSASDIQNFMNPYTSGVVNEMARLSGENVQRNLLPSLKAAFVGTGGLGSRRYAGATGQTLADVSAGLLGQQTGALQAGYKGALDAALREAELQNQSARTQAEIAKMEQELGLTGSKAMMDAGQKMQEYEQAKLDYPLKTATQVSNLMRGYTMPTTQTTTFTGPRAGAYQQSDLMNLTGLLGLIGGAATGTAGDRIANLIKGIFKPNPQTGGTDVDWTKFYEELRKMYPGDTSDGATDDTGLGLTGGSYDPTDQGDTDDTGLGLTGGTGG
jgi:hypothetical protein